MLLLNGLLGEAPLPSPEFVTYTHRQSLCVTYNLTKVSTLDGLSLYGDRLEPDGEVVEVDYYISPSFRQAAYSYTVKVPYAVDVVYMRGVASETHSNVFFNGIAQPRYGYSHGLGVLNGTNHISALVLATNDINQTLYNVTVRTHRHPLGEGFRFPAGWESSRASPPHMHAHPADTSITNLADA